MQFATLCNLTNLELIYNEIRDTLGNLAAFGYWEVVHEPVVYD